MPSASWKKINDLLRGWRHHRRAALGFRQIVSWIREQPNFSAPTVYDIGARWGISPPYHRLSAMPGFRSVGFEPDAIEADKLQKTRAFTHVCAEALGARRENRVLHIAKDPGSSSLFSPNAAEIARHTDWKLFETVKKIDVTVAPLDAVIAEHKLPAPDFMKIDCEGAEQEIMEGSRQTLNQLCGLTFEARLWDFYHGGATFSQLTNGLFDAGFICLRIDPAGSFFGSIVMFDVVMMRHPETIRDPRQFVLCLLFCLLHGNWQYAQRLVDLRATHFGCAEFRKLFLK